MKKITWFMLMVATTIFIATTIFVFDAKADSMEKIPNQAYDDATIGTITWRYPENAKVEDGNTADARAVKSGDTHYLKLIDFNFSVPSNAVIDGIKLGIKRQRLLYTVDDNIIQLVKNNVTVGTNKAYYLWNTTLSWFWYGNETDLWGTTWTPSDINSNLFGAVISATVQTEGTAKVDAVKIIVYYHIPVTNTKPDVNISISNNQIVEIEQDINITVMDYDGDMMNITVKVDNQEYTTFENVTNGTYKIRLYFKNYNYTYNLNISINDGTDTTYLSINVTTNTSYKEGLSKEEADNLFLSSTFSLQGDLLYLVVGFALIGISFQSKRVVLAIMGSLGATFIFLYLLYTTLEMVYGICVYTSAMFMLYFAFELLGGGNK